jgi:hypothetical protein
MEPILYFWVGKVWVLCIPHLGEYGQKPTVISTFDRYIHVPERVEAILLKRNSRLNKSFLKKWEQFHSMESWEGWMKPLTEQIEMTRSTTAHCYLNRERGWCHIKDEKLHTVPSWRYFVKREFKIWINHLKKMRAIPSGESWGGLDEKLTEWIGMMSSTTACFFLEWRMQLVSHERWKITYSTDLLRWRALMTGHCYLNLETAAGYTWNIKITYSFWVWQTIWQMDNHQTKLVLPVHPCVPPIGTLGTPGILATAQRHFCDFDDGNYNHQSINQTSLIKIKILFNGS